MTIPTLPAVSAQDRRFILGPVLRDVSRAFYLTLKVLPRQVREPIGLAYLLARAADTIADTTLLPPKERLGRLLAFRDQVRGPASPQALASLASLGQGSAAEETLMASMPQAFAMLEAMPEPDRGLIREVVTTLTRGMEMDLAAFPPEGSGPIGALETFDDLDRYTYYVAGCVGPFWTRLCVYHLRPLQVWDVEAMSARGVSFGKALQLTNVLRDVPRDLRAGRCYLPARELGALGLEPTDLLEPSAAARARPVLAEGIRRALTHYDDGLAYLLAVPARCHRLRLALAWPLLMGLATLGLVAGNPRWLDPRRPAKVGRRWVYRMMALSYPAVLSDRLITAWARRLRRRVEAALGETEP